MEFDNKGIKTVHISEYPVIVVYIIFVKKNVKAHLGLVLLLLYCICRVRIDYFVDEILTFLILNKNKIITKQFQVRSDFLYFVGQKLQHVLLLMATTVSLGLWFLL